MNNGLCTIDGCNRKADKERLCIPHKEERNKDNGIVCEFEQCDRGASKSGLCNSHYSQKLKGKTLAPLRPRKKQEPARCGTSGMYDKGCRCDECRTAKREHAAQWRAEYKAKHGRSYFDGLKRNRKEYERVCAFCAHTFTTKTHIANYCSLECAKRDEAGWSKSKAIVLWVPEPKPTTAPLNILPSTWTYRVGTCSVCGEWFTSRHMDTTCSDECKRHRAREWRHRGKHARRARKRKAFRAPVYRKKIFERDGYRCHICGDRTNPKARVPERNAPTIDHIIPLAKGGTHEPVNVATACFHCNCLKSDTGTGDQLLLFG